MNGVGDVLETQFVGHGQVDLRDHIAGVGRHDGGTGNFFRAFVHMHPHQPTGIAFENRSVNVAQLPRESVDLDPFLLSLFLVDPPPVTECRTRNRSWPVPCRH